MTSPCAYGASYALKGGTGAVFAACFLAGLFGLVFALFTFMNLADLMGRRGDKGHLVGGLIFAVLTFFCVRAFIRNWASSSASVQ